MEGDTNSGPAAKSVSGPANRLWPQITGMFERLKQNAAGKWQSAVSTVGKTYDATRYLLSGALEKILSLVMNYFVSVLLLFILLPFLYFYILLNLLKDLLQYVLKGRS
jgi:predicted PurR-regulated permease PerM